MNDNELENRVVELETRIVFQEQALSDLSDAIVSQQAVIDRMSQKLERLAGRVANFEETGAETGLPDPPPPHY